jgi:hypothetical protein
MPENAETIEETLLDLHRSVWSIGSTAFATTGADHCVLGAEPNSPN